MKPSEEDLWYCKMAEPMSFQVRLFTCTMYGQGRPAVCRAFIYMVEEILRQGRLEGCHRMSAATHLICGLERM